MAYFIKYTAFCEESKKTQYKAIYLASLFAKFLYTKLNNLAMGFFVGCIALKPWFLLCLIFIICQNTNSTNAKCALNRICFHYVCYDVSEKSQIAWIRAILHFIKRSQFALFVDILHSILTKRSFVYSLLTNVC